MRKILLSLLLLTLYNPARGQTGYTYWYWFDNEQTVAQTDAAGTDHWSFEADVSSLADGFHTLHLQVADDRHISGAPKTSFFYKNRQSSYDGKVSYRCYVDGGQYCDGQADAAQEVFHLDLDVASLADGLHSMSLTLTDELGNIASTKSQFFIKQPVRGKDGKVTYRCYVDGRQYSDGQADAAQEVFHLDLDVTSLTDGLHSMSFTLTDEQGYIASTKPQFFIKQPVGGNTIRQYQYWLNEDTQHTKTVTLETSKDPLQLVTLLPVENIPIRSSLFHFEVTDGQPTVYAKNDFNIRFFDHNGLFVTASKPYVDYGVRQPVEDIVTLKPGVRETISMLEENSIKWYSLEAWNDDDVRFKLSSEASLQLFSASGEVLYEASGTDAVEWGGVTLTDDGIYYLALHDAEMPTSSISLDYTHNYAVQLGDVNGDTKVTAQDASLVLQNVAQKVSFVSGQARVSDMNGDGKITAQDASLILQKVAASTTTTGRLSIRHGNNHQARNQTIQILLTQNKRKENALWNRHDKEQTTRIRQTYY